MKFMACAGVFENSVLHVREIYALENAVFYIPVVMGGISHKFPT